MEISAPEDAASLLILRRAARESLEAYASYIEVPDRPIGDEIAARKSTLAGFTAERETTERALRLLGLFETRSVWTGPELVELLGVTTRTLRRDVERLRVLAVNEVASPPQVRKVGDRFRLHPANGT